MVITKLKYYDEVVNYIYKDDYIVDKIIDYYRDFVMNPNNNRKCILFDKVVYEFLYNSKFTDYVKDEIKSEEEDLSKNFFSDIEYNLKSLYKKFNKNNLKIDTRWL